MRIVVQMIMEGSPEWKELIGEQDRLGSLHVANLAVAITGSGGNLTSFSKWVDTTGASLTTNMAYEDTGIGSWPASKTSRQIYAPSRS